jgi:hypothetical protein
MAVLPCGSVGSGSVSDQRVNPDLRTRGEEEVRVPLALSPSRVSREIGAPEVSRCLSAAVLVYIQNNGSAGSRKFDIRFDTLADNDIGF